MDEGPGKIQEASAHGASFIVMDIAVDESHVAATDVKTPALQNKEGKGHGKVIQRGDVLGRFRRRALTLQLCTNEIRDRKGQRSFIQRGDG